ncbi:hypothetical protein QPK87_13445 [Kamptonema cortianum]|nr:hypothetical protein [Kamptonema cortianum]
MQSLLSEGAAERLLAKEGEYFSSDPAVAGFISSFLGWVDAPVRTSLLANEIESFVGRVARDGFTDAVICGMGGSSLSSLVWASCGFTDAAKGLRLHVLDSTAPADVRHIRNQLDLAKTLVVVASKSGTTVEPLAFEEYFWDELQDLPNPANHMVAITDPGSEMAKRAQQREYRQVFLGEPEVGGRFSAFTVFGMVPAALIGLPIAEMLEAVQERMPGKSQEHIALGAWLGSNALAGHDKLTILTKGLDTFALWIEQLIAESTGKQGRGILPLAEEPEQNASFYGADRSFLLIGDASFCDAKEHKFSSFPAKSMIVDSPVSLANAMYDLEVATAIAGKMLGVNPFDQPNVQAAKVIAQEKIKEVQEFGSIDFGAIAASKGDITIFGEQAGLVKGLLQAFISEVNQGDHLGLLAYTGESAEFSAAISNFRQQLIQKNRIATSFGYGPRYLHSTGQFHKGGPATQHFIVFTGGDSNDVDIPTFGVTFGQLKTAQALGDIGALRSSGRQVLHIDLGDHPDKSMRLLLREISDEF